MSHDNSASLWMSFLETGSQFWKLFSGNWQSVQSLSRVQLFATPWTAIYQASLSITNSQSLLKRMSIESVTPSHHLILCCPFASCLQSFPASGSFPMNRIFESGVQSIGGLASVSVLPGVLIWLISFRIDWFSNPQMQYF